jgi:hypothetical protein
MKPQQVVIVAFGVLMLAVVALGVLALLTR